MRHPQHALVNVPFDRHHPHCLLSLSRTEIMLANDSQGRTTTVSVDRQEGSHAIALAELLGFGSEALHDARHLESDHLRRVLQWQQAGVLQQGECRVVRALEQCAIESAKCTRTHAQQHLIVAQRGWRLALPIDASGSEVSRHE